MLKTRIRNGIRFVVAFGGSGLFFSSSCSSTDIRAVVAGLEAAAQELNEDENDVTFLDWVQSELDDN